MARISVSKQQVALEIARSATITRRIAQTLRSHREPECATWFEAQAIVAENRARWLWPEVLAYSPSSLVKIPEQDAAPPPALLADGINPQLTPGSNRYAGELTARQREVAILIARGYSNAQIAQELVITTGTACNHVGQMLARLELDNRAQIAVWAVQAGLMGLALQQPVPEARPTRSRRRITSG